MAFIEADLTSLPRRVREKVRAQCAAEDRRQYESAVRAQRQAAKVKAQCPPKTRDGFGECTFQMHPYFAKQWERQHGHRPQDDPDAVKHIAKHHEEFRVRSQPARPTFGFSHVEHWPFPSKPKASFREARPDFDSV